MGEDVKKEAHKELWEWKWDRFWDRTWVYGAALLEGHNIGLAGIPLCLGLRVSLLPTPVPGRHRIGLCPESALFRLCFLLGGGQ